MTVVLGIPHLPVIGNVAPQQIAPLRAPGRAFGPQQPGMEALDRRVGLGEIVEGRVDRDDVGVPEIGGRGAARTEIARRVGDRGWRRYRAALRAGLRTAWASAALAPATVAPAHSARPWTSVRRDIVVSGSRCSGCCIASSQCVCRPLIRPGNLRLVRSVSGCERWFRFRSQLKLAMQDGITLSNSFRPLFRQMPKCDCQSGLPK